MLEDAYGAPATKTRKDNRPRLTAHRRSRQGCANCRFRKIKCDERKPVCQKCETYGVACDYHPASQSSISPTNSTTNRKTSRLYLFSDQELIVDVVNAASASASTKDRCQPLTKSDLKLLDKFRSWTLTSLGTTKDVQAYRSVYMSLGLTHAFLRHIMVTTTLVHDRQLGEDSGMEQTKAIAYHWSEGAAMLNRRLTEGVEDPSEKDAMWACAGLLGALSFAGIKAQNPTEAWPLSEGDLDWLYMVEGKREIWRIADPLRSDSIFYKLRSNFMTWGLRPSTSTPLHGLASELAQLCEVDPTDQKNGNPYWTSMMVLSQLLDIESSSLNVAKFLAFFGCMEPRYKVLLTSKDARALLLMAYWYSKMSQCRKWWSTRRTILEGQAICIYLRRFYSSDQRLMSLLSYPEDILRGQTI